MNMSIKNLFLEHPASVGESYTEHLAQASGFGSQLLQAGFACLIHGLFPNLCKNTGSKIVGDLHERMISNRRLQTCHRNASE